MYKQQRRNIMRKGFLNEAYSKKDKTLNPDTVGKASEIDKTSGKLSNSDQQLANMGISPKEYREQPDQSNSEKKGQEAGNTSNSPKKGLRGFFNRKEALLSPQSPEHQTHDTSQTGETSLKKVDKGEPQDSNENQIKYLSKNFWKLGGNVPLENAKIICLGDMHGDDRDTELNAEFINMFARKGDVVLVEAKPADEECKPKEYFKTKKVSKDVKVFGWENYKLYERSVEMVKRYMSLKKDLESKTFNKEERTKMQDECNYIDKQFHSISIVERNKVLQKSINAMKERYPNSRIIILAGLNHFTKDTSFKEYLNTNRYVIFKPATQLSDDEIEKKTQKYYET